MNKRKYAPVLSLIVYKAVAMAFILIILLPDWRGGWNGGIKENQEIVSSIISYFFALLVIDIFLMWRKQFWQIFAIAFGLSLFAGIAEAMLNEKIMFVFLIMATLYNLLVIVLVPVQVLIDKNNQKKKKEMEKNTEAEETED